MPTATVRPPLPPPVQPWRTFATRTLTVLVFLTLFLAPLEGYLHLYVHAQAAKILPVLLLGSWVGYRLFDLRLPRMSALSLLALAMIGIVLVSTAVNTTNVFGLEYTVRWVPFLLITICLADLLGREVLPRHAIEAMALGATAAGASAIFAFVFQGETRATGPMEDPNDLAYVLAAGLPLLLIGVNAPGRARWVRIAGIVGGGICLIGMAATVSRGGALAALTMFAWAILRKVISWRTAAVIILAVLVGALGLLLTNRSAIETALAQKEVVAGSNIDARTTRWQAALAELGDHPLLGVGPGGNRHYYLEYSHRAEIGETTPVTHNMYVEVGSELGLLGLAVFVAMILVAFDLCRRAQGRATAADRSEQLALEASLIAICVASTFLSEEYYMPLWATMATMVAVWIRSGGS